MTILEWTDHQMWLTRLNGGTPTGIIFRVDAFSRIREDDGPERFREFMKATNPPLCVLVREGGPLVEILTTDPLGPAYLPLWRKTHEVFTTMMGKMLALEQTKLGRFILKCEAEEQRNRGKSRGSSH